MDRRLSFHFPCDKCATMLRRTLLILMLASFELLSACDDGGTSGGVGPPAPRPLLTWPRVRRGDGNLAIGGSGLANNDGTARMMYDFATAGGTAAGLTLNGSTPILGRSTTIYLATDDGLLSVDPAADKADSLRWLVDTCDLGDATRPPLDMTPLRTSPTLSGNGRDMMLVSNRVYRLREPESGDDAPECLLAYDASSSSAPLNIFDGFDLELLTSFFGTDEGRLLALDVTREGRIRWAFPSSTPFDGPISSAPIFTLGGIAFTAPDGRLYIVDPTGRLVDSSRVGDPYPEGEPIPPPVLSANLYALSAAGTVVAFSAAGDRLWEFAAEERISSPVNVTFLSTDGGAFVGTNVVFVVDDAGTAYGVRANDGEMVRFCTASNFACQPSTCPDEGTCGQRFCSNARSIACSTDDGCLNDDDNNQGTCEVFSVCSNNLARICDDDDECDRGDCRRACSNDADRSCAEDADCGDEGICQAPTCSNTGAGCDNDDQCTDNRATCDFFCQDDTTMSCTADTCTANDDFGSCSRPAIHPIESATMLAEGALPIQPNFVVSSDAHVAVATRDGRICARRLDGVVPDGRCTPMVCLGAEETTLCNTDDDCTSGTGPCDIERRCTDTDEACVDDLGCPWETCELATDPDCVEEPCPLVGTCSIDGEPSCDGDDCTPRSCRRDDDCIQRTCDAVVRGSQDACAPDSCAVGDRCCKLDDTDCDPGTCIAEPTRYCTPDTCDEADDEQDDEVCVTDWQNGCIDLIDERFGATTASPLAMDGASNLFFATEKGLVLVE